MLRKTRYQCPGFFIRPVASEWQMRGARELRRRVFVEEQNLFDKDDVDEIDAYATQLVAISTYAHEAYSVVGAVRIHEEAPGLWWGSRLAVDKEFRQVGRLGAELIKLAVRTANSIGCDTFLANVQKQNVVLFRRLHWRLLEEIDLHGAPHARMSADLARYPALEDPAAGWYHKARQVAA